MMTPLEDRVWSKVDRSAGLFDCWPWVASRTDTGYGQVWDGHRLVRAHRLIYELLVGPIPEGLTLDHLCRNRACVNPAHLEPVTMRENTLRGIGPAALHAAKTHCKYGHPFAAENLHLTPSGIRVCLTCRRALARGFSARHPGYHTVVARQQRREARQRRAAA
jgi:hypothetical protein